MTKNDVKPQKIMLTVKDHNPGNLSTINTIYNERKKYRHFVKRPITEMQHLMNLLVNDNYVYSYRKHEDTKVVKDLFWAHADALKFVNTFPIVFLIDSTYKTNRYRLPLLEIVGVTSTNLTFSIACAYLENERTNNFKWALERFKELFEEETPVAIVTNRDIALLNVVNEVFPRSRHLLCQFHINKNVRAMCRKQLKDVKECDKVMELWLDIVDAAIEEKYVSTVAIFEESCQELKKLFQYVDDTWLIPYKDKFVRAWIHNVMHLGNTTTNRYINLYLIIT